MYAEKGGPPSLIGPLFERWMRTCRPSTGDHSRQHLWKNFEPARGKKMKMSARKNPNRNKSKICLCTITDWCKNCLQ